MAISFEEIEVHFRSAPDESLQVGTLARHGTPLFFQYNSSWVTRGIELSPLSLPLRLGLIEHTNREFGPLFGLFDDSLPDGWGLLLMNRYFRKAGLDPVAVSPLDRLIYLGNDTMGALTYHPSKIHSSTESTIFNIHELAKHSQEVFAGNVKDVLPKL